MDQSPELVARPDPRVRIVWAASFLVPAVVIAALASFLAVIGVSTLPFVLVGAAAIVGAAGAVYPVLQYRAWSYVIRLDEVIVRFGVVMSVERWIPRSRVQHVDLRAGPIERSMGLRTIMIYTAGTREAAVAIPGLRFEEAEWIRDELLDWSRPIPELEESMEPADGDC
jgi:membrane protein YdbS with pleckstrin-like domain